MKITTMVHTHKHTHTYTHYRYSDHEAEDDDTDRCAPSKSWFTMDLLSCGTFDARVSKNFDDLNSKPPLLALKNAPERSSL
jgi:hypothetical protein